MSQSLLLQWDENPVDVLQEGRRATQDIMTPCLVPLKLLSITSRSSRDTKAHIGMANRDSFQLVLLWIRFWGRVRGHFVDGLEKPVSNSRYILTVIQRYPNRN